VNNGPVAEATSTQLADAKHPRFRAALVIAFFALLWLGLWRQLSGEWSVNDQYSYGWFVPFFAIVLFWLRFEGANFTAGGREPLANRSREAGDSDLVKAEGWDDKPKAESGKRKPESGKLRAESLSHITRHMSQAAVALCCLLLLFPIRLFEIGNPDWRPLDWLHALCVVAITLVFLWWIGGKPWLKHFLFPVAFTLVAVPWVTPIEEPIVQGLMRLVANIASEAAALFGIPTSVQGNLIRIPSGLLGVNEACSGVRSLQTSLMIGLLFGELKRLPVAKRVMLVITAAAIAFVGNCIRAFCLVWIAATQNVTASARWHDWAGYGIVAAVFGGTLALTWALSREQRADVGRQKSEVRSDSQPTRLPLQSLGIGNLGFRISVTAIVWLCVIELAATGWYRLHERDLAQAKRWDVQWPQGAEGLHEIKIEDDVRRILRFDSGRAASWTVREPNADGGGTKPASCTVYFFRWNSGKNSALLANLHRPDVCLPAIGWKQSADSGVKDYRAGPDLLLPFRHFAFHHGADSTAEGYGVTTQPNQQTAQAFYCLWEDRVPSSGDSDLPNMSRSRSAWTRAERVRVVLEGRRHLGQQVLEIVIAGRGELDAQVAEKTFVELMPGLVRAKN